MRAELVKQDRDFGFCVTVQALKQYASYWSRYTNSYRCNPDTLSNWKNLVEIYETYFDFREYARKGHYFDLDMLDFGTCRLHTMWNCLSDDEKLIEFSMRAFLNSPIQISSTLENVTDFELSVYCNEEILSISQDCAFNTPSLVSSKKDGERYFDIWEKELDSGDYAYAFFNFGNAHESVKLASQNGVIRDVWAKEDILDAQISLEIPPHTVRILKSKNKLEI